VLKLIGTVAKGYAGPDSHNLWLESVDRIVKMKRGSIYMVYEPAMWRELGFVVRHSRGERRVTHL